MNAIIELAHASYSYGSQHALHDVSLTINRGDYLGIVGPNGAGKSTLTKLMLGLARPTDGTVKLWGTPVEQFRDWHKIGYIPQRTAETEFRLPITVREVVQLGASGAQRATNVHEALTAVGIESLADRLITELSGGQQQKAFIAKALASRPELLILDEPTTGIDAHAQDEFYELLATLNQEHKLTLVLVSHDLDVIANEATKLALINETLVYYGTPRGLAGSDYLDHVFGGTRKLILHEHHND